MFINSHSNNLSLEPAYLGLFESGELKNRAQILLARLNDCDICPRKCGVDRTSGEIGFCNSAYLPIVASFCDHHGEEPALSGIRGSGTIFFGNCNMKCVYCQNYQISQNPKVQEINAIEIGQLVSHMIYLQDDLGCHNINFVSPSHFVPQMVQAILEAIPLGLKIPLVYNSSGYDSLETIKMLDGVIDIYLPDLRYASDAFARKYSQAQEYVSNSREVIKEMYRQVGDLLVDEEGVAKRGLIVRHLVLPNNIAGSEESLRWLATEVSNTVTISVMSQYAPAHRAKNIPLLSRKISKKEYTVVLDLIDELGLENGWTQEMDSVEYYVPDFNREGHPFEIR